MTPEVHVHLVLGDVRLEFQGSQAFYDRLVEPLCVLGDRERGVDVPARAAAREDQLGCAHDALCTASRGAARDTPGSPTPARMMISA